VFASAPIPAPRATRALAVPLFLQFPLSRTRRTRSENSALADSSHAGAPPPSRALVRAASRDRARQGHALPTPIRAPLRSNDGAASSPRGPRPTIRAGVTTHESTLHAPLPPSRSFAPKALRSPYAWIPRRQCFGRQV